MEQDGAEEVGHSRLHSHCHQRAKQVVLETEYDNSAALGLYESLGFIREKRLYRFYLNGKDAFRLVLVLRPSS